MGLYPTFLGFPVSVDMESGCGPDFIPVTVRLTIVSLRAVRKSRLTGVRRTIGILKWRCLVADIQVWKEERFTLELGLKYCLVSEGWPLIDLIPNPWRLDWNQRD